MIRTISFFIIIFAAGLLVGRNWQKPQTISAAKSEQSPRQTPQTEAPAIIPKQLPATTSSSLRNLSTTERLQKLSQTLSWFKNNGGYYSDVPVFDDRGINSTFANLFGLSSSEQKTLEDAIKDARRRSIEMRTRAAKISDTSKGDVLVIEIPTQPEVGGQIYDTLLGTFQSVLGTDRFQYFNFFAGEPFERALDSYGALRNKFEITRVVTPNGTLYFSYKKYHGGPGSELNNWNGGNLDPDGFAQFFPELAPLIPPAFKTKPAR